MFAKWFVAVVRKPPVSRTVSVSAAVAHKSDADAEELLLNSHSQASAAV